MTASGRGVSRIRHGCRPDWGWRFTDPHWQLQTDPDKTSEVEVRFTAESPDRTRVDLEHRNLERHGSGWEGVREGVGGDDGWPLYLQRFAAVVGEAH